MPNPGLIWFCECIPPRGPWLLRVALCRKFLKLTSFQIERLDKDSIIEVLSRDDINVNSRWGVIPNDGYQNKETYIDRYLRQI